MENNEAICLLKDIQDCPLGFKDKENQDKLAICENILASGVALPDKEAIWLLYWHQAISEVRIKQRHTDAQLDLLVDRIRNS